MYNWSVKQQFPIFKNVGGVIRTIGVSNMQYYAKKWLSSTCGSIYIKYQKSNFK